MCLYNSSLSGNQILNSAWLGYVLVIWGILDYGVVSIKPIKEFPLGCSAHLLNLNESFI